MPPQLIQPRDKYLLKRDTVDRRAVMEQLRLVLTAFAARPGFSRFYIGITKDLDGRLAQHQVKKPEFKLMVPVYEEPGNMHEDSFDRLEKDAIAAFRAGIVHPDTKKVVLQCANGPGGAPPKTTLYVLVG